LGDARRSPGLVDRLRALPYARHSFSMAAQLVAFDSGCCAPPASCTVPLVFLPKSALVPARLGLSPIIQSACEGQTAAGECVRAPLDVEDGVMAASRTRSVASLACLPPTMPRRAWQIANSESQLLLSDATLRGFWAWLTAPNETSATRITTRLLQRTGDESAVAIVQSCVWPDGRKDRCSAEGRRQPTSLHGYG
jgi:hypothetical protein